MITQKDLQTMEQLWMSRIDGNTTEPGTDPWWWESVSKLDT